MRARDAYVKRDGQWHAAAAPRFSRTPGDIAAAPTGEALLKKWSV
jgi:hypothetical protein